MVDIFSHLPTNSFRLHSDKLYAIKKFKADKEGEVLHYTGVSQSACREMAVSPHTLSTTSKQSLINLAMSRAQS